MRLPEPIPAERLIELNNFRKEKWPGFEFQRFYVSGLEVNAAYLQALLPKQLGGI